MYSSFEGSDLWGPPDAQTTETVSFPLSCTTVKYYADARDPRHRHRYKSRSIPFLKMEKITSLSRNLHFNQLKKCSTLSYRLMCNKQIIVYFFL
jgi:hypothetical protein